MTRRARSVALVAGIGLLFGGLSATSMVPVASANGRYPTLGEYVASNPEAKRAGWMPSYGLSKAAWTSALTDDTVKVGDAGRVFFVEPKLTFAEIAAAASFAAVHTTISTANAFLLHSNPSSTHVIYLDFTGHTLVNTAWNPGTTVTVLPYDIDNNTGSFSTAERQNIIDAWSAVAEDYSMFDVDVTTEDPGIDKIQRTSYSDNAYGVRALVTDSSSSMYAAACNSSCQGVAYGGTFDYVDAGGNWDRYSPAFIFSETDAAFTGKIISDVLSHEVGHNIGLSHDGISATEYYSGRNGWAPIMGAGYSYPLVQWSNGDYLNASNTEADLSVAVSTGLPLKSDDFGGTTGTATSINLNTEYSGVIGTRTDVDYFSVVAGSTSFDVDVTLPSLSPDLDVSLSVLNAAGTTIATANPSFSMVTSETSTGLAASVTVSSTPGATYYIKIDGVGFGTSSTGYSDYGSIGEYSVEASGATDPALTPGTPTISGSPTVGQVLTGTPGTWAEGVSVTTAWLRDNVATGDTDNSYTLTDSDFGKVIKFQVTGTKAGFATTTAIAQTAAIAHGPVVATANPVIAGKTKVGQRLMTTIGTWPAGTAVTLQWLRNNVAISGATEPSYKLVKKDKGKKISVRATGVKSGYLNGTATSTQTAKIK